MRGRGAARAAEGVRVSVLVWEEVNSGFGGGQRRQLMGRRTAFGPWLRFFGVLSCLPMTCKQWLRRQVRCGSHSTLRGRDLRSSDCLAPTTTHKNDD